MKNLVFDSFAFIALFKQETGYELVKNLLTEIARNESEGYISAINLGEIYYMISRKSNSKNAEFAIAAVKQMPIHIIEPDIKMCLDAAQIKANYKLSYADAFAASLTIAKKATLITGDKEFDNLAGVKGFKVRYL